MNRNRLPRIRITRSIIPNLFTLMNLLCGFIAIVHISKMQFTEAAWMILAAAVFDSLDGAMARLTKSTSELGVELDSLCDAVSFGVAPSFMVWNALLNQMGNPGLLISALPALAGVYRLARFNVQVVGFEDKKYFSGMPIPAGALTIVSYIVFFDLADMLPDSARVVGMVAMVCLTALAMVSTVKFDNFPRPSMAAIKERPLLFAFVGISVPAAVATDGKFAFPAMALYLVAGFVRHIVRWFANPQGDDDDTMEQDDPDPLD